MSRRDDRQVNPADLVAYLNRPPRDGEVSDISGNATDAAKALARRWHALLHRPHGFISAVALRVRVTDVSIFNKFDAPGAPREARVTFEVSVTQDMLAPNGDVLQEISLMLIDECTMAALALLDTARDENVTGIVNIPGYSRAINNLLHTPARTPVGGKLRVVTTTTPVGENSWTSQCEIWDTYNHILVASGFQMVMQPVPT